MASESDSQHQCTSSGREDPSKQANFVATPNVPNTPQIPLTTQGTTNVQTSSSPHNPHRGTPLRNLHPKLPPMGCFSISPRHQDIISQTPPTGHRTLPIILLSCLRPFESARKQAVSILKLFVRGHSNTTCPATAPSLRLRHSLGRTLGPSSCRIFHRGSLYHTSLTLARFLQHQQLRLLYISERPRHSLPTLQESETASCHQLLGRTRHLQALPWLLPSLSALKQKLRQLKRKLRVPKQRSSYRPRLLPAILRAPSKVPITNHHLRSISPSYQSPAPAGRTPSYSTLPP